MTYCYHAFTCTYAEANPAVTIAGSVLLKTSPIMGLATLKSPKPQQPTKKLVSPSAWNCGVLMAMSGVTFLCVCIPHTDKIWGAGVELGRQAISSCC